MSSKSIQILLMIHFCLCAISFGLDNSLVEGKNSSSLSIHRDLSDRAWGIHNASNIGLYFENVGRISRDYGYGDGGEYPINSSHNYLFRLAPMVAIARDLVTGRPTNVMQSLYVDYKELEAVSGYHGPPAKIAFSDDISTWPESVWFFQNEDGEDHIVSTQDSYCVYDDANNLVEVLGIQIAQTGYAFGLKNIEDMIFFTFEITNTSMASYDSVYFGFYHDFDVGNNPDGDATEYLDDLMGFDHANDFIWAYEADDVSIDWRTTPGMMGIAMLESPLIDGTMAGITDMHLGKIAFDDATMMTIFSSNLDYLPPEINPDDFFNLGGSANIHYDNLESLSSDGLDVYGTISSGPFSLSPEDTLKFIIGLIAGNDLDDLYANLDEAHILHSNNFETAKPPAIPILNGVAGDGEVTLFWSNEVESLIDKVSMIQDFEGYNLYRSQNKGLSWDQVDRNQSPDAGPDAIPLASYDRVNGIGDDLGIAYSYRDETVINGIEYWYSLTAFDQGDANIGSLESPIGNSIHAVNVVKTIPVSAAVDFVPGKIAGLEHYGGKANYTLSAIPSSPEQLNDYTYDLSFHYAMQNEIGNSGIWATIEIVDSSLVPTLHFGFRFTAEDQLDIINIDSQLSYWSGGLSLDVPYPFEDYFTVTFHQLNPLTHPSSGDLLSLNFCAELLRFDGQDTLVVIPSQRFDPGTDLVSDDGLILSMNPQATIQNINVPPILDFEIEFDVADLDSIQEMDYQIIVTQSGIDEDGISYLVLRTTDENSTEIGVADTLYNGWSIQYRGWTAQVRFDPAHPPPPGSSTTFSTLPAIRPTIQDYYQFGIIDAISNPDILSEDMNEIRVVPNPYMAGSLWESEQGSFVREPVRQIQFTNLPVDCEINIFTLSGELIKTLDHAALHGTETWDLRAEGGREIVSGIYLYQVKSTGFEYINRFAVIK